MKKLLLISALLIFACSFGQGGQLHANGTAIDQDGNNFEWINYGTQNWAIENAEVVTYRDGTIIPQVDNPAEWSNLTTGAWCYSNGDPNNGKLYNWYAVAGIYDLESLNNINIRKELAPDGWRVPTDIEWTILETFLISSGFNYDRSTSQNKIAGVIASIEWGSVSSQIGAPGYNSNTTELNNSSRFKAEPDGRRGAAGNFIDFEDQASFWSLSESSSQEAWKRALWWADYELRRGQNLKVLGFSIRFVRDVSTASTSDNSTINFKIFPNPTKEYLNIDCSSLESVSVYNILGKELMKDRTKRIDVSSLSKGIYFINVFDGINTSTKKFIKD